MMGRTRFWVAIISILFAILVAKNESLLALILYQRLAPSGSGRRKVQVRKVNDSLYELEDQSKTLISELQESRNTRHELQERSDTAGSESETPESLLILFFHGFVSSDSTDAQLRTWESEDGSCIWPVTWLVETFPGARVMFVSYSASLESSSQEQFDMVNITENLASDLMQENIAQKSNCPIILVGHCVGGVVIKQLCLHLFGRMNLSRTEEEKIHWENFLENIKGIFYYGTPHVGSPSIEKAAASSGDKPLLKYFQMLSKEASRLNFRFSQLCKQYTHWQIQGLGESIRTNQGPFRGWFRGVLVAPDACARAGDLFNVVPANHITISKPRSKSDRRYYALAGLLNNIVNNLRGHEVRGLPRYLIDMEKRAQDFHEKLKKKDVLGIFGMGGIGKTTLAKLVYNKISKEFEYTCFVENVRDKKIHELEDWVLSQFHRFRRKVQRISWLGLEKKKILIVMDDVDARGQLVQLPTLNHFGSGSKIIITSRNQEVWKDFEDCNTYEVNFLEDSEATKLFCHYAFDREEMQDQPTNRNDLDKYVATVVDKCDRLPLTLEVTGSYLRGISSAQEWEEIIEKLAGAQGNGDENDRVFTSLKVSYDALGTPEKKMFIEAATIFLEQPLDEALAAWSTSIGNSETTWRNLLNRSMVKGFSKTSFNGKKEIWVHQQLRDLATRLAKGDRDAVKLVNLEDANEQVKNETKDKWLADRSMVQLDRVDTVGALRSMVEEDVPFLRLNVRSWTGKLALESLANLGKLKYLQLDGVEHEGSGTNFPKSLSLLKWVRHSWTTCEFPISLNHMYNLAVLTLEDWDVPEGFSEQLGNLRNLRRLCLKNVRGWDTLPDISSLSRLKDVKLEDLSLSKLPESLGKLRNLVNMALCSIGRLKSLPRSFGDLCSLVTLRIDSCQELASLPSSFGQLALLKDLTIRKCPKLQCLPESFSQLQKLQRLSLDECDGLQKLEESFGNLSSLRYLVLSLPDILVLPENFGRLHKLEELKLGRALRLHVLPESIVGLSALRIFRIEAPWLKSLPEGFGRLGALQDLRIQAAWLRHLPESFGHLGALQDLRIESAWLRSLPESFGHLGALRDLRIRAAWLNDLPESFGRLSALQDLRIEAAGLQSLPESFGHLGALRDLRIQAAWLKRLPESFGQLFNLQNLHIWCGLERLPESFGFLARLGTLDLRVDNMRDLPKGVEMLSSLVELKIHTNRLERLQINFGRLSTLRNLQLLCDNLKELPDSLGELYALEELSIWSVSLEKLPESIGGLRSLEKLDLQGGRMKSFPEGIRELSSLREFTFNCDGHKVMPNNFDHLPCSRLYLIGQNARMLPKGVDENQSVEELHILHMESLGSLPKEVGNILSLRSLAIVDCKMLESIKFSLQSLSSLREIRIADCNRLTRLPYYLGSPPSKGSWQIRNMNELMKIEELFSSQATAAEGPRLYVKNCLHLDSTELRRLGWVEKGDSTNSYYVKEET